ncbi:methyltransferase [Granulicella sp. L60]|uniref:methyltransferase n=1 Tax=Granulicella sp. L60 TaxID=1641866 RepID=UPI001C2043CD|nr:methyltransferase [Granulicella sp. L60]
MDNMDDLCPDTSSIFDERNEFSRMFRMIMGFSGSQIVHAAATFSLAEHLAEGVVTAAEIAELESTNVDAMFRLMRACASLGLLRYDGKGRFATTDLLNTLHRDDPHTLRGAALSQPAPLHWMSWGHLSNAIRTGEPQATSALGCPPWEYLAKMPAESDAFTMSMHRFSAEVSYDAAILLDTQMVDLAVDIGGASGTLLHALMRKNRTLRGVVYDLPHVASIASEAAYALGLSDRLSVEAGDFFASVPTGDLYLLKSVLHDWNDDACVSILSCCRRAINPEGRLVVVDMLVDEIGARGIAPIIDLTMLVLLGGRQRSLDEYKVLFSAAGFRFVRATPTTTPSTLIEAIPI